MDSSSGPMFVIYTLLALFVVGTILKGLFQVRTAEAVVVQRMGKFLRVANAGINFKLPWVDQIAGRIDLRVQQLALDVETKTKDNVFVKIPVSVQYHVIPDKVYEAFYKLANPKQQISSYGDGVVEQAGSLVQADRQHRVAARGARQPSTPRPRPSASRRTASRSRCTRAPPRVTLFRRGVMLPLTEKRR